jgi:hypothetical protein
MSRVLQLAFALFFLFSGFVANADFYYHPYYQQQRTMPIISLTLDPQEGLNSDLRVAAREGRIDRIKELLKQGANVNGLSDQGESALMYTARDCRVKAAELLLSRHALFNLQDRDGKTALIYAAIASCSPIVSLLTNKSRIDVLARDKSGFTALDYARDGASLYVQGPPVIALQLIEQATRRSTSHLKHLAANEKVFAKKKKTL